LKLSFTDIVANLYPTYYGIVPFDSSDILRSVITRTKVLLLHLLDGTDPGAAVSDLYDNFQVNPDPNPNDNPNLNPTLNLSP
jgi:hypothetical protein